MIELIKDDIIPEIFHQVPPQNKIFKIWGDFLDFFNNPEPKKIAWASGLIFLSAILGFFTSYFFKNYQLLYLSQ